MFTNDYKEIGKEDKEKVVMYVDVREAERESEMLSIYFILTSQAFISHPLTL